MEIGNFTIKEGVDYPDGTKSVWIEQLAGEGGQFPVALFEQAVREFYDKNF